MPINSTETSQLIYFHKFTYLRINDVCEERSLHASPTQASAHTIYCQQKMHSAPPNAFFGALCWARGHQDRGDSSLSSSTLEYSEDTGAATNKGNEALQHDRHLAESWKWTGWQPRVPGWGKAPIERRSIVNWSTEGPGDWGPGTSGIFTTQCGKSRKLPEMEEGARLQ